MFYSFHVIGTYYYYTNFSLILGTTNTPKYYDIFRLHLNFWHRFLFCYFPLNFPATNRYQVIFRYLFLSFFPFIHLHGSSISTTCCDGKINGHPKIQPINNLVFKPSPNYIQTTWIYISAYYAINYSKQPYFKVSYRCHCPLLNILP